MYVNSVITANNLSKELFIFSKSIQIVYMLLTSAMRFYFHFVAVVVLPSSNMKCWPVLGYLTIWAIT